MADVEPSKSTPDIVSTVEKGAEKGGGFLVRHWGLAILIGVCIVLSPLLVTLTQIFVGVGKGIGAFGKTISDLLGPAANYLSAMGEKCKENPGSWDCWLFEIASFVLPVFGLLIPGLIKGKLTDTTDALAKVENKTTSEETTDLATKSREKAGEVISKLTDEQRPDVHEKT